ELPAQNVFCGRASSILFFLASGPTGQPSGIPPYLRLRPVGLALRAAAFLMGPWLAARLAWRPTEHSSAQEMQVNMVDRLARSCIHIEHRAIALLMDLELLRQFLGNLKH